MTFDQYLDHVDEFNHTFTCDAAPDANLRLALVVEEAAELWKAQIKGLTPEEIEGEWGDVLYVVFGWALVFGIDIDAAMAATAAKNQKKIENRAMWSMNAEGKVTQNT